VRHRWFRFLPVGLYWQWLWRWLPALSARFRWRLASGRAGSVGLLSFRGVSSLLLGHHGTLRALLGIFAHHAVYILYCLSSALLACWFLHPAAPLQWVELRENKQRGALRGAPLTRDAASGAPLTLRAHINGARNPRRRRRRIASESMAWLRIARASRRGALRSSASHHRYAPRSSNARLAAGKRNPATLLRCGAAAHRSRCAARTRTFAASCGTAHAIKILRSDERVEAKKKSGGLLAFSRRQDIAYFGGTGDE